MAGRYTVGGLAVLLGTFVGAAADPDPVTLVDAGGKEIKLAAVKFTAGTRRLGWLADPKGATDDAKKGPLALEVREAHSTGYAKGVVTLVPVASVEAVRYEYDKQALAVAVKGLAEPVAGTLQFRGINAIGFEGDAGGVVGKFAGGTAKDGFKSLALSGAKPLPTRPAGATAWAVQIDHPKAMNPTLVVRNLKALYAVPGGTEHLADALPVRKGDPLPLSAALKKLEILAVDTNTQIAAAEVTTDAGADRLVALSLTRERDKKTAVLVGLLGEVDAGWKLFPLHTIKVVKSGEGK